jgi:cell division protein FtsQ
MAKRQNIDKSRAETIRTNRQQNRKSTTINALDGLASRKQNQHSVPITRRRTAQIPPVTRKTNKVNIPLKKRGAELQLPAFPDFHLGWRIISGALFFLSLAVVFSFTSLNTFKVSAINLQGAHRLEPESILSQIELGGTSIITIKPEEIETRIVTSFPGLREVHVSIGLPATVTVQVVERQPLVLWEQADQSYWIDVEGVMFPVRGETIVPLKVGATSYPPAGLSLQEQDSGDEGETSPIMDQPNLPTTTPEFVQGILSINEYVPQGSQLQYDPQFGLGWQDPRGWLVYFGRDTQNIELKLAEYQTIVETLQKDNLIPSLISLEFLHAPFYKLEQ